MHLQDILIPVVIQWLLENWWIRTA